MKEAGAFTLESGYIAAKKLLQRSERPTALFTTTDWMAFRKPLWLSKQAGSFFARRASKVDHFEKMEAASQYSLRENPASEWDRKILAKTILRPLTPFYPPPGMPHAVKNSARKEALVS